MTNTQTVEAGIVNRYLCAALDAPDNGLVSITLSEASSAPAPRPNTAFIAASMVLAEQVPICRAASRHYQAYAELFGIVRTPDDGLFGLVDVEIDLLGPSPTIGRLVVELAINDGERGRVIGGLFENEAGMVIQSALPEYGSNGPDWQVGVSLLKGVAGKEIVVCHSGQGETTLYRADPLKEPTFSEAIPLDAGVWYPPTREIIARMYA